MTSVFHTILHHLLLTLGHTGSCTARVCRDLISVFLLSPGPTNTKAMRARTNNGASVSPILMLCEAELRSVAVSCLVSLQPTISPRLVPRLSPSLLSLPPFVQRPAPFTSSSSSFSSSSSTSFSSSRRIMASVHAADAPSQRAIEGLSCRRVARYILFISAATTKPRVLAAAAFTVCPKSTLARFVSMESVGAPNCVTPHDLVIDASFALTATFYFGCGVRSFNGRHYAERIYGY